MKKANNNSLIKKEETRFEKHLLDNGLTLTTGRKLVFDVAMASHGHFTAEELAKKCGEQKKNVSRATVYRSIKDLLEARVIRETAYGKKHQLFEHIYDEKPHHHARCIRCLEVLEFPDLDEEKRYHPMLERQGFHVLGHEMHFYGICKNCNTGA